MMLNHTKKWLFALGLQLGIVSAAVAQSEPDFVPNLGDVQLFEQPDLSPFGRGEPPNQGWFGSAEILTWSISAPEKSLIGTPGTLLVFGTGSTSTNTGTWTETVITNPPSTAAPPGTIINPVSQFSSADTGWMQAEMNSGSRYEFGFVDDNVGWFASAFVRHDEVQEFYGRNVAINFAGTSPIGFLQETNNTHTWDRDLDGDGVYGRFGRDRGNPFGNPAANSDKDGIPDREDQGQPDIPTDFDDAVALPTVFDYLDVVAKNEIWGVEFMGSYRVFGDNGVIWELFAGPRYLVFADEFNVQGIGGNLDETQWDTRAENHLVGGQFGIRWSKKQGRVTAIVQARGFGAANFQSIRQEGVVRIAQTVGTYGSIPITAGILNLPDSNSVQNAWHAVEFSPAAELRLDLNYQLFRGVKLQAGWTAIWSDNVARASNMVSYTLPNFGIIGANNMQDVFINGFNCGVVVNR